MIQRIGRSRQGAAGVSSMSSEGRGDVGVTVAGLPRLDLMLDSLCILYPLGFSSRFESARESSSCVFLPVKGLPEDS